MDPVKIGFDNSGTAQEVALQANYVVDDTGATAQSHMQDSSIHLSSGQITDIGSVAPHVNNTGIHISTQQASDIAGVGSHISNNSIHLSSGQATEIGNIGPHISNNSIHLSSQQATDIQAIQTHMSNNGIHVSTTQAQLIADALQPSIIGEPGGIPPLDASGQIPQQYVNADVIAQAAFIDTYTELIALDATTAPLKSIYLVMDASADPEITTAGVWAMYIRIGVAVAASDWKKLTDGDSITVDITDALTTADIGIAQGVAGLGGDAKVPATQLPAASTATPGITQLNSTIETDETTAATPTAVKAAYDEAVLLDVAYSQDETELSTQNLRTGALSLMKSVMPFDTTQTTEQIEMKIYDDPSNPPVGHKVKFPVTSLQSVIDPSTGDALDGILDDMRGSLGGYMWCPDVEQAKIITTPYSIGQPDVLMPVFSWLFADFEVPFTGFLSGQIGFNSLDTWGNQYEIHVIRQGQSTDVIVAAGAGQFQESQYLVGLYDIPVLAGEVIKISVSRTAGNNSLLVRPTSNIVIYPVRSVFSSALRGTGFTVPNAATAQEITIPLSSGQPTLTSFQSGSFEFTAPITGFINGFIGIDHPSVVRNVSIYILRLRTDGTPFQVAGVFNVGADSGSAATGMALKDIRAHQGERFRIDIVLSAARNCIPASAITICPPTATSITSDDFLVVDNENTQEITLPISEGQASIAFTAGVDVIYPFTAPITGFLNGYFGIALDGSTDNTFLMQLQRQAGGSWDVISSYNFTPQWASNILTGFNCIPVEQGENLRIIMNSSIAQTGTPNSQILVSPPGSTSSSIPNFTLSDIDSAVAVVTPLSTPNVTINRGAWNYFDFSVPYDGYLMGVYGTSGIPAFVNVPNQVYLSRVTPDNEVIVSAFGGTNTSDWALSDFVSNIPVSAGEQLRIGIFIDGSGTISIPANTELFICRPKRVFTGASGMGFMIPDTDGMQNITTQWSTGQPTVTLSGNTWSRSTPFEIPITGFLNGFVRIEPPTGNTNRFLIQLQKRDISGNWIEVAQSTFDTSPNIMKLSDIKVEQSDIFALSLFGSNGGGVVYTPLSEITICPPKLVYQDNKAFFYPDTDKVQQITTPLDEGQASFNVAANVDMPYEFTAPITGFLNGIYGVTLDSAGGSFGMRLERQDSSSNWQVISSYFDSNVRSSLAPRVGLNDIQVEQGANLRIVINSDTGGLTAIPNSEITICPPVIDESNGFPDWYTAFRLLADRVAVLEGLAGVTS